MLSAQGRAATARAADGAWVLPSEMVWDAESLFQHSHSHTSGGLRSVAAVEVSMAAAAELKCFGLTQLCLSPAISPVLAVTCLLAVLCALSPSLPQPPVPCEAAKSEI